MAERDYVINMNDTGRTGLSLAFTSFKMVDTGMEVSDPPDITELGRGLYTFAYDPFAQSYDISYVASDGTVSNTISGRIPRQAWSDYITLNFDDPALTGLSLTFQDLRRVDNNVALSTSELFNCTGQAGITAPTITELGSGRYTFKFRNMLDSDVWFSVIAPGGWPFMTGVLQRDTSFDTTNGVTLSFIRRSARLEYDVPSGEHYTDEMLNKWCNDAYFEFVKKTNWLLTKKTIPMVNTTPYTVRYQLAASDRYFRPVLLMAKKAPGYAQDIKLQRVGRVEMEEAKKINMHRRFDGIYNVDRSTSPYTIEIFIIGNKGYERYANLEFHYFRSPINTTYDNDAFDIPVHYSRGLIAHVIHRVAAEDGDTVESQRQYGIFLEEVADASKEINETNDPDHRDIMDLYTDEYDDEYYDRVAWS